MKTGVTIAIPTFNRGRMLTATLALLDQLRPPPDKVIAVDQTAENEPDVHAELTRRSAAGTLHWIRLPAPSIPHAMNVALLEATTPLVLFMDDDVVPSPSIVAAHAACFESDPSLWAVAGQILQPGERPEHHPRPDDDLEFRFNHDEPQFVTNVMAGNLAVVRERALQVGGFDENFTGAAYRFESDFAVRLSAAGGRIRFEPAASLRHLHLPTGGLRSYGDHRSSPSASHSAGDFYYALRHRRRPALYAIARIRKNAFTRWHVRHPWAIVPKLIGEFRGLLLALRLHRRGARLLGHHG